MRESIICEIYRQCATAKDKVKGTPILPVFLGRDKEGKLTCQYIDEKNLQCHILYQLNMLEEISKN